MTASDKQIQARLDAKKRLRIYNPSLTPVSFEYEGKTIVLEAQEITDLSVPEGRVATNALVDYMVNTHGAKPNYEQRRAEILKDILV